MAMSINEPARQSPDLDLSAGLYLKGIEQNSTTFLSVTSFNPLQGVNRDPRELQPGAKRSSFDDALEEEASIHELIQRALIGNKKANVPKYADYIREVVSGERTGVLP